MKYLRISAGAVVACLLLNGCSSEKRDWAQAKASDTTESYAAFVQNHPQSQHVPSAKLRMDTKAWEQTKARDTLDGYAAFIGQHPRSQYVSAARTIIDTKTWEQVKATDTVAAYLAFVDQHPQSQYVAAARATVETKLWEQAKAADTIEGYRAFIDQHPQSQHVPAARGIVETKLWEEAKATNTIESYLAFIDQHPDSQYHAAARSLIEGLAWEQAKGADTPEGYAAFIGQYSRSQHVAEARDLSREVEKRMALEKIVAARDVAALKAFVAEAANEKALRRFKLGEGTSFGLPSQPMEANEGYHLTLKAADEPGMLDYLLSIPPKAAVNVDFKERVSANIVKGNLLLRLVGGQTAGQMAGENGVTLLVNLINDRHIVLSAEYVTIDPNMFVRLGEAEFVFTRADGASLRRELAEHSFHVAKGTLYHTEL